MSAPYASTKHEQLLKRFTSVYEQNMWADPESISGPGSRLDSATVGETIAVLTKICTLLPIRSLNDIPCGDLNWISAFIRQHPGIDYTGYDIVPLLIERNRAMHPDIKCDVLDIVNQVPPPADLVLCKDLIIHLGDADIRTLLSNIRASRSTYLLASNNFGLGNTDLTENIHGESVCRYVDIIAPPFNYPPPIWRTNYLGLWRVADL